MPMGQGVGDNSRRARPMIASIPPTPTSVRVIAIVAAYNEADRIAATLAAIADAFPEALVWVADDGSTDGTAAIARAAGARVVRSERMIGKGGAVTLAVRAALSEHVGESPAGGGTRAPHPPGGNHPRELVVVLCDGDLRDGAERLRPLAEAVRLDQLDMAVAAFARRVGGGLGLAVGFAGWAIRR